MWNAQQTFMFALFANVCIKCPIFQLLCLHNFELFSLFAYFQMILLISKISKILLSNLVPPICLVMTEQLNN